MPDNRNAPVEALFLQIFFRSKRTELDVMNAFTRITGIEVDSLDFPKADACGVAMFARYPEGFALGVLVTWPSRLPLATPERELVGQLVRTLKTAVLLESAAQPETWLTASEDGVCSETGVEFLNDGIELS